MIRALYSAATGMQSQQLNIDVIANNLANVNTAGFKKSRADFQDLLYQTIRAPGTSSSSTTRNPAGIQLGLGAKPGAVKKVFGQGDLKLTENPLDMAIQGNGFFKILLPDGSVAYTRDGSFTSNQDGQLVNSAGYELDPPVTVPQDALSLTIGADGRNSIVASQLGLYRRHPSHRKIALCIHYEGIRPVGGHAEVFIARDRYGILNPLADGATNVNLVVDHKDFTQARGRLDDYFRVSLARLPDAPPVSNLRVPDPAVTEPEESANVPLTSYVPPAERSIVPVFVVAPLTETRPPDDVEIVPLFVTACVTSTVPVPAEIVPPLVTSSVTLSVPAPGVIVPPLSTSTSSDTLRVFPLRSRYPSSGP